MKKLLLLLVVLVAGLSSFGQTKKELQDIVTKRNASIDSLIKIVENQENIIENRDRSIRFLNEDVAKYKQAAEDEAQLKREKHAIIQKLRKQMSSGEPNIRIMDNSKNVLKVPSGKFWVVHQFMSDYSAGMTTDSTGATIVEEVHVFIKEMGGKVLTDPAKDMYGPKLYSSLHPEQMIRFPLVLTEGTQFKIVVLKGELGSLTAHTSKVYITYTEKDNE